MKTSNQVANKYRTIRAVNKKEMLRRTKIRSACLLRMKRGTHHETAKYGAKYALTKVSITVIKYGNPWNKKEVGES